LLANRVKFEHCTQGTPLLLPSHRPQLLVISRLEEQISNPVTVLRRLCAFLNVPAEESFLANCAAAVWPAPKITRHQISWAADLRHEVEMRIAQTPLLMGYRFDA
jgi:hypothetical protein